jgi:hypothetical protein
MSEEDRMNENSGNAGRNNSIHSNQDLPSMGSQSPLEVNSGANFYGSGSLNNFNSTSEDRISMERDISAFIENSKFIII